MRNEYEEENPLIKAAFTVIMEAGNAREHIFEALQHARKNECEEADQCMKKAKSCIVQAHEGQTEVIRKEADGEKQDICILFIHAQDTLMTIMSEYNMAMEMLEMYRLIYTQIKRKD